MTAALTEAISLVGPWVGGAIAMLVEVLWVERTIDTDGDAIQPVVEE